MQSDPSLAIQRGAGELRCPHGKTRGVDACVDCWESLLLGSLKTVQVLGRSRRALDVHLPCEHYSEKRRCKICKGSWICAHGVNKVYCAVCDGRRLCQMCFKVSMPRCYEACKKCREGEEKQARLQGRPAMDMSQAAAKRRRLERAPD